MATVRYWASLLTTCVGCCVGSTSDTFSTVSILSPTTSAVDGSDGSSPVPLRVIDALLPSFAAASSAAAPASAPPSPATVDAGVGDVGDVGVAAPVTGDVFGFLSLLRLSVAVAARARRNVLRADSLPLAADSSSASLSSSSTSSTYSSSSANDSRRPSASPTPGPFICRIDSVRIACRAASAIAATSSGRTRSMSRFCASEPSSCSASGRLFQLPRRSARRADVPAASKSRWMLLSMRSSAVVVSSASESDDRPSRRSMIGPAEAL
mmetsp:Transcript_26576/g.92369  ORF Transcript_26576/g.92369 Transcript_26576/m.92369 type:complete len:267 (-) Transcript_26576:1256-2056(-)